MEKIKSQTFTELLAGLLEQSNKSFIHPLLQRLNNNPKEDEKLFISVLFKLRNGLETINLLFHNLESNRSFSDSIFILLRSLLADMITVIWIIYSSEQKGINRSDVVIKLNSDHIRRGLKVTELYPLLYNTTLEEMASEKKKWIDVFPQYFDEDGKLKREFSKGISITNMVKEICSQEPDNIFKKSMVQTFVFYDTYSKYEHLGEFTSAGVIRGFRDNNIANIKEEVKECIIRILEFKNLLLPEFYSKEIIKKSEYYSLYQRIFKEFVESLPTD